MKFNRLAIILFGVIGGAISRWHGGGFFKSPKLLKAFIWSLPLALAGSAIHSHIGLLCQSIVFVAVILLSMVTKNTGHGGGIDYGSSIKEPGHGRTLEKIEYLIYSWAYKALPRKAYDALLLGHHGVFCVLPCAISFLFINPNASLIIIYGGALKALAYALGHEIYESKKGSTEFGEFMTGVFAYITLAIAYTMT